jgi:hypothetical protein
MSMQRQLLTLSVVSAFIICVPLVAVAQQPPVVGLAGAWALADLATLGLAPTITEGDVGIELEDAKPAIDRRPTSGDAKLLTLSIATAALQGLDAYTTMAAVHHGAQEANPMMRAAVRNPVVWIAVKSSMTAATIYAARRLWPRNKAAAVTLFAVSNCVLATVVARNVSVLRQVR